MRLPALLFSLSLSIRQELGWFHVSDIQRALEAPRVVQFCEFFCGTGRMVSACSDSNLRVAWYDWGIDPEKMNLSTAKGFAQALKLAISLCVKGSAWFGVPCYTFVVIAMGHTKRSFQDPLGDTGRPDVREANKLVVRVVFLLRVLAARGVYWVIENPCSTVLFRMPALVAFFAVSKAKRRFLWLGHFGHLLLKPTVLFGTLPRLHAGTELATIKRKTGRTTSWAYISFINKAGRKRFTGRKGLKKSQEYCPGSTKTNKKIGKKKHIFRQKLVRKKKQLPPKVRSLKQKF